MNGIYRVPVAEQVGDFPADVAALMARAATGAGPQTMDDIRRLASDLAAQLDTDPGVLDWMKANAMALIGQQLLVASVQSVADPRSAFDAALDESLRALGAHADAATVILRLMDRHPGALRAWLVRDQLPKLLAERLDESVAHPPEAREPASSVQLDDLRGTRPAPDGKG